MELGLQGRTAVVAASTGGLGEAVARALAAEGASVVVSGRRGDRARALAAELPSAVGVEVDLTDDSGPAALVDAALSAFGPVDVAVLNGPGPKPGTAADLTPEDVDAALSSLVRAQHRLVSLVLPGMRERGWGRVLAIGSSGVVAPLPGLAASNLGRAALAGYLKTLAGEVAADGVTVNLLLPGRVATDRVAALDEAAAGRTGRSVEQVQADARGRIPAGRYGRPEEFGAVGAFLCSEAAGYVTGVALRVDGGLVAAL
jgi:3-oxoacyl-[acyl-carrier protein] reductase